MTAYIAAMMIRLYQRYISPYKGFRCAHRALHGGPSCSEFARLHVLDHGVWAMLAALRMRFQECRLAKETLLFSAARKRQAQQGNTTPWACDICGGAVGVDACCSSGGAETGVGCDALPVDSCDCPCG